MTEENAAKLFRKHYKADVEILQSHELKSCSKNRAINSYRIKIPGQGIAEFAGVCEQKTPKPERNIAKQLRALKFDSSIGREIHLYRRVHPDIQKYLPEYFWHKGKFFAIRPIKASDKFTAEQLPQLIDALTDIHAQYFNRENVARKLKIRITDEEDYARAKHLIRKNWQKLAKRNEQILSLADQRRFIDFIEHIDERRQRIPRTHRTLTHNHLTPKAIILARQPIIVDWQHAHYQAPEHDLIEILCYFAHELTDKQIAKYIDDFRTQLRHKSGYFLPREDYAAILNFNLFEYAVNRQAILRLGASKKRRAKTEQYFENLLRIMRLVKK